MNFKIIKVEGCVWCQYNKYFADQKRRCTKLPERGSYRKLYKSDLYEDLEDGSANCVGVFPLWCPLEEIEEE